VKVIEESIRLLSSSSSASFGHRDEDADVTRRLSKRPQTPRMGEDGSMGEEETENRSDCVPRRMLVIDDDGFEVKEVSSPSSPSSRVWAHQIEEKRPSTAPKQIRSTFQSDSLSRITAELLETQRKCALLEAENQHLKSLLRTSSQFLKPDRRLTKGQQSLKESLKKLNEEIERRQKTAANSDAGSGRVLVGKEELEKVLHQDRENRAQIANLKVLVSHEATQRSDQEINFKHERSKMERTILELQERLHGMREAALVQKSPIQSTDLHEENEFLRTELRNLEAKYKQLYSFIKTS